MNRIKVTLGNINTAERERERMNVKSVSLAGVTRRVDSEPKGSVCISQSVIIGRSLGY